MNSRILGLFHYEIKILSHNKGIWIVLILLALLQLFIVSEMPGNKREFESERESFYYEQDEKDQIKEYSEYLTYIGQKAENAATISIFTKGKSDFSIRSVEKAAKDYKKMEEVTPVYIDSRPFVEVFQDNYTNMVLIVFMGICVLALIMEGKANKTLSFIRTTQNGRGACCIAKMMTIFLISGFSLFFFYGIGFLYTGIFNGRLPLNVPLQSLYGYDSSTLRMSVAIYCLFYFITKWLVLGMIGILFLCVGLLAVNYAVYIAGIFGITVLHFSLACIKEMFKLSFLRKISFVYLLQAYPLYRDYENMNILGKPVNHLGICWGSILIGMIFCSGVCIYLFLKMDLDYHKIMIMNPFQKYLGKRVKKSLLYFENLKLVKGERALWILLVSGIMFSTWFSVQEEHILFAQQHFKIYANQFGGALNGIILREIAAEEERIKEVNEQIEILAEDYRKGNITQAQWDVQFQELQAQILGEEGFWLLQDRVDYLEQYNKRGEAAVYIIYDDGWNTLFGKNDVGKNYYIILFSYNIFLLCVCLSGVFSMEYQTQMNQLIYAYPIGRKSIRLNKWVAATGIVFMVVTGTVCIYVLYLMREYGLPYMQATLSSLPAFEDSVLRNMPIFTAFFFLYGIALLVNEMIAFLIMYVSYKTRNKAQTIMIISILGVIADVLLLLFW